LHSLVGWSELNKQIFRNSFVSCSFGWPENNTDDRYLVGHERLPLRLRLGNEDHHRQGRRFAAGGNGHDPRDVEIERLRQRVRKLEINPFDRYERQYEDTATDTAVEEYENEGHLKKDCPNKQVLTLIDEADQLYDTEDEVETEVVYPDWGELLVTHRLLNTVVFNQDDEPRRSELIFFVFSAQLRVRFAL
nr:reverse transcriptase domain-containing protein [Tanacetum cinerariifolium]